MKKTMKKLVIFGASIMERSFDIYGNYYRAKAELFDIGFKEVELIPRANGGETSSVLAGRIDSVLSEFTGENGVVFFVHAGGNDVSSNRPYDTATVAQKAALGNSLQYIVNAIEAAGHTCVMSSITYRTYPDVPPESNGSLPYNEQIVNPLIQASLPEYWNSTTNRPSFDLYTQTINNLEWISADNVHPTTAGQAGIRNYIFSRLSDFFESTDAKLTSSLGTNYVVDLGSNSISQPLASINKVIGGDDQFQVLKKTTGPEGSYILLSDFDGSGTTGRGNTGDSTTSLTNDDLLKTFWYVSGAQTGVVSVGGLANGCNGAISFTASRNTTSTDRVAEITVQGITKTLDGAENPAAIVSFDFSIENDANSIDAYIKKQDGSTFAYISGIEIIFNEYIEQAPAPSSSLIGYTEEADFTAYAAARGITLLRPVGETLTLALDYIELQSYSGYKTDPSQPLEFPRDGSAEVPANIATAQMQTALVYDSGVDPLAPVGAKVLEKTVHGAVTVRYSDKGGNATSYPQITKLLAPYLSSAGGSNFVVSRG